MERAHPHIMTETTLFGIDRDTVQRAGWPAVVVLIATLLFVEPWLEARGWGTVALAIYVALLPVIVWSLLEDVRSWRASNGGTE